MIGHNSSIMTQSKLGSISKSGLSQITENTFHSPKRISVRERATTVFTENQCKRPADYIKLLMKQNAPQPKGVYEKVSLPEIIGYNQQYNEKYNTHKNSLEHINIVGIQEMRSSTML